MLMALIKQLLSRLLPLFEKLPDEKIRLIADRSQTYEYLADKIIEKDSGCSEFVYICRKVSVSGFCFLSLSNLILLYSYLHNISYCYY